MSPDNPVRQAVLGYIVILVLGEFVDAYAANRVGSLVNNRLRFLKDPSRNGPSVRQLLLNDLTRKFSSGVIKGFGGQKAWLVGAGSQVRDSPNRGGPTYSSFMNERFGRMPQFSTEDAKMIYRQNE
ncbi:hypothetical protein [uncultured Tateyamaria sp.]|uniref:hypothetical protein n=1 Tax=uncultured Tateyamaria sp. TaxID=455651 RepID=UPI002606029C|nr:hypothetical protein [uncultured Tateyamaria sp.]